MGNTCKGKKEISVILIGLDLAGKTTILNQLRYKESGPTNPTVGFNFETLNYKKLNLSVWDTGGQNKIRDLWKHYYDQVDGILFVVDSADELRIDEAKNALHGAIRDPSLQNAFVCVLANKRDLKERCMPIEDIRTHLQLPVLSQNRQLAMIEVSALTGDGLDAVVEWLSKQASR